MSYTYAIADMHGRYDLYRKALIRIMEHAKGNGGTLIVLGDFVDRGPQSKELMEALMAPVTSPKWTKIVLKGNHEDMMVRACRNFSYMNHYLSGFGGFATLLSFGLKSRFSCTLEDLDELIPVMKPHIDWADKLPVMHKDKHRIYVHAGLNPHPLERNKEETLMWWRYKDEDEGIHRCGLHVVHGHEQNALGPLLKKGRSALDTHAYKYGRLAVGIFDDDIPGGPVDVIWAEIK